MMWIILNAGARINCFHKYKNAIDTYPDPEETRMEALPLLYVAGESFLHLIDIVHYLYLNHFINRVKNDTSLMNNCRRVIRDSLIQNGRHRNLFELITILPLPRALMKYLLYNYHHSTITIKQTLKLFSMLQLRRESL